MFKDIINEANEKFKTVKDDYLKQISKFRTGRASITVLDNISVDYFGTPTPLNQLATLSVPESNLIMIQPWDSNIINDVEKAIRSSNLDLNPISDGKVIKLPIPPLDEQRRMEIVKMLKKYNEERKTQVRNIRREYRDKIKKMKDDKDISEDDEKKFYEQFQKIVDEKITELETITKDKEKHILDD